jgi:hypothetical protein
MLHDNWTIMSLSNVDWMHLMPVPLVLNRVLVVEKFKTQVFRDLQDGANIRHPLHIKQFRRA